MENTIKDKAVTLRLSTVDIYMLDYVFNNYMMLLVRNCPDMIETLIEKFRDEIINAKDLKINLLFRQYEKIRNEKPFAANDKEIAGTKLSVGKPYNVLVSSKVINDLQKYIINHSEIKKPHSSWIIQLAILNGFLPLAKKYADFDISEEKNKNSVDITENEKFELIEKFIKLFKNTKFNISKINQIKQILESE